MKKQILSSVVSASMLLSLCSFSVNAQESLTIANYNVMSNAITLEFSGDVTSVLASVTNGNNTISADAEKVGDNSKVWNLKLNGKMDITKKYILDFTAVPSDAAAYSALSAREAITFDVLWNDDFSSYESIEDVKKNYSLRDNNNIENPDWSSFSLDAENDRIKIGNKSMFPNGFSYGTQYGKYYTMEADMTGVVNNSANIFYSTYQGGGSGNILLSNDMIRQNNLPDGNSTKLEQPFKDKQLDNVPYTVPEYPTITISTMKYLNADTEALEISVDGDTAVYETGTFGFDKRYVAMRSYWESFYLNSLKMYKATMQEVSEFGISGYEITSKFVKVNLTGTPATTPNVSVVSLGDALAVNTTVSDNTIVIKPASGSFPLDKEILVSIPGISDSYGQTVNVDKKFKLTSLLTEDFESYTSLEQMTKYSVAFSKAKQRISVPEAAASEEYKDLFAINTESDGNHRLQFNTRPSDCLAYFTFFQAYPQRLNWKDYILEFDVDTDIRDDRNQKKYAMTIIQTASGYNSATGELYNGACKNAMLFEAAHQLDLEWSNIGYYKFGPKSANGWDYAYNTTPQGEVSFIIGPQNDKTIAYLNNEVLYSDTYTPGSSNEGEFAFASNATTAGNTQYIDNIKAYKVEDLAASEVYVKTAAKSGNTVSGKLYVTNRDNTVTGATKAIAAVYDSDYTLIGAKVIDVAAEQAAGSEIDYSVSIPETTEADTLTVRAFWWSGLDTMLPKANSASKTIN